MKRLRSIATTISLHTAINVLVALLLGCGMMMLIFSSVLKRQVKVTTISQQTMVSHSLNAIMDELQTVTVPVIRSVVYDIQQGDCSNEQLQQVANIIAKSVPLISYCGICLDTVACGEMPVSSPFIVGEERGYVAGVSDELYVTQWLNEVREKGIGIWSQPLEGPESELPIVGAYQALIADPDDTSHVYGFIVLQFAIDKVQDIAVKAQPTEHSINQIFHRKTHGILVHHDSTVMNKMTLEKYLEQSGCPDSLELATRLLSGETGMYRGKVNNMKGWCCYQPIEHSPWVAFTFVPYRDIYQSNTILLFVLLALALVSLILLITHFTRRSVRRVLQPMASIIHAAHKMEKGDFTWPIPEPNTDNEFKTLTDTFNSMRSSLVNLIDKERNEASTKARLENELSIAHDIQMDMVPEVEVDRQHVVPHDFDARMLPAREVGGDLVRYFYTPDALIFSIGDVSGKGIPSAIFMSQVVSQLRSMALDTEVDLIYKVDKLNRTTCFGNHFNMFTTILCGKVILSTGELVMCNAGHECPLLLRPDGSVEILQLESNIPIGLVPDYQYQRQSFQLDPGSVLVLYTDGVTEAADAQQQLYGEERLMRIVEGQNHLSASQLIDRIMADIKHFAGDTPQADDITLFVFKYR